MFSSLFAPLQGMLRPHFALSKTRLETLAILIVGLVNSRTVNLSHLASQFPGAALLEGLPEQTRQRQKPFRLNIPVTYQGTRHNIGVEPDYAFSLANAKLRRRAFFLAEVDRGTMPVERYDLKQTSILRKLLAYQTLWKAKRHVAAFGWRNFRVLFITTSKERVENMRAAMNSHALTRGSPLFLFADKDELYSGNILGHEWQDGEGKKHRLKPA